jgi:hypothetical protein
VVLRDCIKSRWRNEQAKVSRKLKPDSKDDSSSDADDDEGEEGAEEERPRVTDAVEPEPTLRATKEAPLMLDPEPADAMRVAKKLIEAAQVPETMSSRAEPEVQVRDSKPADEKQRAEPPASVSVEVASQNREDLPGSACLEAKGQGMESGAQLDTAKVSCQQNMGEHRFLESSISPNREPLLSCWYRAASTKRSPRRTSRF